MRFAQGFYAFGFWIVIALAAFFFFAIKTRRRAMQKFAEEGLLGELTPSFSLKRKVVKYALLSGVFVFGIIALMRPQWGYEWQEVKRRGLDILIAIDTSKSMLASDVKPNRLDRSKLAVKDLIKKLQGDRIGLIAFSGTAYLQCPLTVDYNGFQLALHDLDVDTIPRGGTSIGEAIRVAMKSYEGGHKKYKVLIIITDGEDHEGSAVGAAKEASKDGLKIFCIGIGTTEGDLIQLVGEDGKRHFLRDKNGTVIKSRLDESVLKQIALKTGGTYIRSSGAQFGLDLIYEQKLSKMEKKEIEAQMNKFYYERFQIPVIIALLLLICETFISERKRQ